MRAYFIPISTAGVCVLWCGLAVGCGIGWIVWEKSGRATFSMEGLEEQIRERSAGGDDDDKSLMTMAMMMMIMMVMMMMVMTVMMMMTKMICGQ